MIVPYTMVIISVVCCFCWQLLQPLTLSSSDASPSVWQQFTQTWFVWLSASLWYNYCLSTTDGNG